MFAARACCGGPGARRGVACGPVLLRLHLRNYWRRLMHAVLTLNIGLSFILIGEVFSAAALHHTHCLGRLPLGRRDPAAAVEVVPRAGVCVAVQHSSRVHGLTDGLAAGGGGGGPAAALCQSCVV